MAGSLNKWFGIGNLCADPETRMAGSTPVANFRIACNESWKDKDGNKQERVEYITIVARLVARSEWCERWRGEV